MYHIMNVETHRNCAVLGNIHLRIFTYVGIRESAVVQPSGQLNLQLSCPDRSFGCLHHSAVIPPLADAAIAAQKNIV